MEAVTRKLIGHDVIPDVTGPCSLNQQASGICAWLLFVEGLLAGDVANGLGDVGRLLPGAAAAGVSGQYPGTLLTPAVAFVLLAFYAVAAVLAGAIATSRRDVG